MKKVFLLLSLFVSLFLIQISSTPAQTIVPVRFKDVRTIYVDDRSFRFLFSPCAPQIGTMVLPCPNQAFERERFLIAFKRWLIKSGFTLAESRESAEGIIQGTLSIDDSYHPVEFRRDKNGKNGKKDDDCEVDETSGPKWSVDAWLVNQDGRRLWRLGGGYPSISYMGGPAKVEGKKLAKALEYDLKHSR